MKIINAYKIILVVIVALFVVFWTIAFIKVCPSYSTLDVPGIIDPNYRENIFDKIFDKVCPALVNMGLISLVNNVAANELPKTDLEHLKDTAPSFTGVYSKIGVFEAWNTINNGLRLFSSVSVGILDTGVDASNGRHPEFERVNLGNSPNESLRDNAIKLRSDLKAGHGTPIAGVIGANNLSQSQTLPADSPQMNGIISGVFGLPYVLELRGTIFDILSLGKDLETLPQKSLVNISYENASCPKIFFIEFTKRFCIKEADFEDIAGFYSETFFKNRDKLFIISAGNSGGNTENSIPANINRENTIVVSSTDLDDHRADFSNSGSSVKISAPGVQVYAPSIRGQGDFPTFGTNVNNYKTDFRGTSISAPLVTGVAAILKALEPEYRKYHPGLVMTPTKIKEVLMKSADPIKTDKPLGSGCFDPNNNPQGYNGCRLNAHRAVAWLLPPTPVILNTPIVVPVP